MTEEKLNNNNINSNNSQMPQNNPIKKTLKILLVSDIHENYNALIKLGNYISTNNISLDYIFASGDFLNMTEEDHSNIEIVNKYELSLSKILKLLRNINKNVIIIPGNHDNDKLFDNNNMKYEECINVHNKLYKLDNNQLYILGFGGSVPGIQNNSQVWEGYPFKTTNEFNKLFKAFIDNNNNNINNIKHDKSVILLTHIGPYDSNTSIDWTKSKYKIYAGSKEIQNLLFNKNYSTKLICNIHGHVHESYGQTRINGIEIINPGSLKEGKNSFGLLTLEQSNTNNEWSIRNIDFRHL